MREVSKITWGFYMALRIVLRTIDLVRPVGVNVEPGAQ
jgi:hypothetical protein